jgi:uncharacterized protein
LRAARKGKQPRSGPLERVTYTPSNAAAAKPGYNLVAGTTWLFAGNDVAAAPVDVLVIDEAGQMSRWRAVRRLVADAEDPRG